MNTPGPSSNGRQELPNELWSYVIDIATFAPGEFGVAEWTGNYDPLDLGQHNLYELTLHTDQLHQELQIRLNFALVSRLWNSLARKRLYQTAVLKNHDRLERFLNLLNHSPDLALLVKRLDVSYLLLSHLKSYSPMIKKVVGLCPNLLLLVDPSEQDHPSCGNIIRALEEGITLSKLSIQQLRLMLPGSDRVPIYPPTLSSLCHLRALYLTSFDIRDKSTGGCFPRLSLPSLELLDLSRIVFSLVGPSVDAYLTESYLPRLYSLTIAVSNIDPRYIRQFLAKFGPQIRTLGLTDWARCESNSYDPYLPFVPLFPNLEQLIIPAVITSTLLSEFAKITSIRRLGIFCDWGQLPSLFQSDDSSRLFRNVRSVCFMCLPMKGKIGFHPSRSIKLINSLDSYLKIYKDLFQSLDISIGLNYTGTHNVVWTDDPMEIISEIRSKLFLM